LGQVSEEIWDAVICDMTDLKGLRHAWDNIDDEMQADIRAAVMLSVRRVFERLV
jgi:hypothetical protein